MIGLDELLYTSGGNYFSILGLCWYSFLPWLLNWTEGEESRMNWGEGGEGGGRYTVWWFFYVTFVHSLESIFNSFLRGLTRCLFFSCSAITVFYFFPLRFVTIMVSCLISIFCYILLCTHNSSLYGYFNTGDMRRLFQGDKRDNLTYKKNASEDIFPPTSYRIVYLFSFIEIFASLCWKEGRSICVLTLVLWEWVYLLIPTSMDDVFIVLYCTVCMYDSTR